MSRAFSKRIKKSQIKKITKAFLFKRYIKQKLTLIEIAGELDLCVSTLRKLFRKFKIETRKPTRILDLRNKKFNKLTVIEETKKPENTKSKWVRFWRCRCDCGQETVVASSNLVQGGVKSCGCSRLYRNEKLIKKYGQEAVNNGITSVYWYKIFNGANSRNIEFTINMEYAYEIYLKQDKLCALSGRPISFVINYGKNGNKQTASLDRIDNSKGYIKGNIQWLHKDLNRMKSDMNEQEFIKVCKDVARFRKNK